MFREEQEIRRRRVVKRANGTCGQRDTDFVRHVRNHVLDVLGESSLTFEQILRRSLNCDPAVLITTLQELENANLVSITKREESPAEYCLSVKSKSLSQDIPNVQQSAFRLGNYLTSSQTQYLKEMLGAILNSLPEPTPVYSQWWFSKSIYEDLIKLLLQLSKPRSSTAFIGASTIGALFSQFSTDPVTVFDVDQVLLEAINRHSSKMTQIVHYDVSSKPDSSFKNTFKLVFVDPPWSSHLLRTFLARSSTFVSAGGSLAISFPPILTRPSMEEERKDLIKLAKSLGLSLRSTLIGFTQYSVPLFEQKAYENYGIHLKKPWRRGDLLVFTKAGNNSVDITPLIEKTADWNQYHYGKCRLFLKRDGLFEDGHPSVKPILGLEDLIYKSTSTRLSSWRSASLVSTRNHIAHAYGRRELSALLERTFEQNNSNHENNLGFTTMIPVEIQETLLSMLNTATYQGRHSANESE